MSNGIKRRDFLKVLGVGGAGATVTGCSTEGVEKLLPYVVPPEDITPGVATWYTTVCGGCDAGCGMWVRTREGRVVKVEGNPNHDVSRGALCSRGHASIQGLYHPDRFTGPMRRVNGALQPIGWDEAEALLAEQLQGANGEVVMIHGAMGPTMSDLASRFLEAVNGTAVQHDGLSEAALREATRIAFGRDGVPRYDMESAHFLISFGADFLETWGSPVAYSRAFSRMSSVGDHQEKGQFVFVGPRLSLTGQNADEWMPIKPGAEAAVALGMAAEIAAGGADAGPWREVLAGYDVETAAAASGLDAETIRDLARRFVANGPSLAIGPGLAAQHRGATAAHVAVHILNSVAGNVGRTVRLADNLPSVTAAPYGDLAAVISRMGAGQVSVALVHGANPAYSLPAGSGFAEAFGNVGFKVSFASEPDETSDLADLILPDRHFLEAWGDSNPRQSLFAVQQPAMQPVPHFDSKQTGDVLLSVAARLGRALGPATVYEHLVARWQAVHAQVGGGVGFEAWWKQVLKDGFLNAGEAPAETSVALKSPDAALSFEAPSFDGDGEFTLVVYPSPRFGDGKFATSPWMQELPDPVSKLAWHSWVEMHPDAAERLGVRDGDVVSISSPHGSLEVPVWTYPGVREDTVALAMGGGRTNGGRYGTGRGVNALSLLPAEAEQPSGALVLQATTVSVAPTGRRYKLATIAGTDTQHDRNIAPAVQLAALGHGSDHDAAAEHGGDAGHEAEGDHGAEEGHGGEGGHHGLSEMQLMGGVVPVETDGESKDFPLPGSQYGDYSDPETPRWAMAIDLDKCTGCSACVVACQSENNVPWVGEDQVAMGRDLAWIRIERYYEIVDAHHAGPVDVRHLPMLCQHCGNAPCEPVCPVFAAYHTPDGLNGQIYNRCVGTRYCANNCPYKVRVFNWYTYTDVPAPLNWAYNPDVTVRANGVMEKCSFCVQRIRDGQNRASLEGRGVHDGEIVTACQQSCPAEAIVFGNIKDPESTVAKKVNDERTYRVLDALINTQPAVNYQKKVTFHEVAAGDH